MVAKLVLLNLAFSQGAFLQGPLKARAPHRRKADVTANLLSDMFGMGKKEFDAPCVMGEEEIMSQKAHGTSATPVQQDLRWG